MPSVPDVNEECSRGERGRRGMWRKSSRHSRVSNSREPGNWRLAFCKTSAMGNFPNSIEKLRTLFIDVISNGRNTVLLWESAVLMAAAADLAETR